MLLLCKEKEVHPNHGKKAVQGRVQAAPGPHDQLHLYPQGDFPPGDHLQRQRRHRQAGVGDDLPQEDLLVGVDGVDHQVHQTLGFRFELLLCHVAHLLYINIFENSVLALFAFEC